MQLDDEAVRVFNALGEGDTLPRPWQLYQQSSDLRLRPGMHAILLTLGSQDMRITTPPVQLMDPATAALPLLLTVEIAGAGTLGEKHSMELPSRSSTSGTELHFHTKDLATASFRFNIVTKTSFALKATANTGPLSLSRPVSLWNEREPLGGRAHLPFIDLVTGAVFAMLMFEFVVVTWLDHPEAHVKGPAMDWSPVKVIGHRGAGKNAPIRDRGNLQVGENTILSFMTAGKLGAEYIEFDAQLTRDHKVAIYHDWKLTETGFPLAVNDLSLSDFLSFKPRLNPSRGALEAGVSSSLGAPAIRRTRSSGDMPWQAPRTDSTSGAAENTWPWKANHDGTIQNSYTSLEETLKRVPAEIGFNIEIKYPFLIETEMERLHLAECNMFVDAILRTALDHGGSRKIFFSSFHAECARMAKLKQSKYPVLFLTVGGLVKTNDARSNSVAAAATYAALCGFAGVVSDARPLVKCPRLVQVVQSTKSTGAPDGLKLLTYGGANSVRGTAKLLQKEGITGLIVDAVKQVVLELAQ